MAPLKKILLMGSGYMAEEYLKVLRALQCEVLVVGLNEEKTQNLAKEYGYEGFGGGIKALSKFNASQISWVINATSVDALAEITWGCAQKGYKNILVEKPGSLNLQQLNSLNKKLGSRFNTRVACNRRFYNSVLSLQKQIKEDPLWACFFDFTDREKDLESVSGLEDVVQRWGWANSIHVIDLAFFLIGLPKAMHSIQHGSWNIHPSGHTFVGSGISPQCPFSYFATWRGGGRWNLEISTSKGRYKLSPMEELHFCRKNQFQWEKVALADEDDVRYKPGVYKMVKSVVLANQCERLATLSEQKDLCKVINKIFGYEN